MISNTFIAKMKRRRAFSFSLSVMYMAMSLCAHPCIAQQDQGGSIRGRVITADGLPAYVTVELKKQRKISSTDNNGYFILTNLPALQDTLIFTSVQSRIHALPVRLARNQALDAGVVRLTAGIAQLQDIEVTGRVAHSYKSDYSYLGTKTQTAFIDIPQSISTITKELITDKMEFTLKDAADEAAGVNQYSGYDDYTIRGFKAENARLINGLRGYNTTYTSAMLVNIERIEVIKGPSATLYGNCDPGGTINLVTKKPLENRERTITLSGGSWDHFRAQGDITGPLNANKTLLYRFNAGYDNTRSFRDQFFARSYELAPSFSFIPNDRIRLNVDFSLSHINTVLDRGQPGFQQDSTLSSTPAGLTASQPGDYLRETKLATNLLFSWNINKRISFNSGWLNYLTQQNAAEHGVHSYVTSDSVNLYFSKWDYQTVTNTFTDYFTFRFNTGKFRHQVVAGYDYITSGVNLGQQYYERPDLYGPGSGIVGGLSLKHPIYRQRSTDKYQASDYDSESSNVESTVYNTQGIYLQEQLSIGNWKLLLGAREDSYEAGGNENDSTGDDEIHTFLPRVGLVYELNPHASVYASYNKGFDPFEASTSTQVFNAPFKPVTSELLEAGAKAGFLNNKLSASLAFYQLTLRNVAVNANDITNPNLYVQQGEDRSRGIETEANGNILPNLSLAVSYSYCVAKVIRSKIAGQQGALVENAPKNSSNSWIKYIIPRGVLKGFGIAAGHSQVGARNTVEPGLRLPGYLVLNAGLRYSYKQFNAAFNLNNITDRHYWIGAYNNVNKWPGAPGNCMISIGYGF